MKSTIQSAGDTACMPASLLQTGTVGALPAKLMAARDGSATVRQLIDAYMAAYSGRDTTRTQRLSWWAATMGDITLAELSDDHVFDALEALANQRGRYFAGKDADGNSIMKAKRKPLAPATLNRYQAALSAVLTWTQRRRIAPKNWQNPCRNVELKPERNEIVRFLSDTERGALLAACRASTWSKLYLIVMMGLTTGARRGELEALRWADVDLERAEAAIHRSKNGDKKVLPLVPAVLEALAALKGAPNALVFPSQRRPDVAFNFGPAWDRALKVAGVKNFRFHDLRHSCASALAQSGATLLEIAEVLGHRQLSVTKRYSHLATSHKAKLIFRVLGDIR